MLTRQEVEFINVFILTCLNTTYSKRVTPSNREDYKQDILIKVILQYHRYDPAKGTVKQWVGRIIKNYIIDQERKNPPINYCDDLSFHGEKENEYDLDADKLYQDRLTHLNDMLDEESEENREMLKDFYLNGLSNHEIARIYHQSESVLAMRRKRFKERVRRTYRKK